MNKLKVLLGSSVASLALVAGLALPAAAATQTCSVEDVTLGVAGCLQSSTEVTEDSPTNGSGNQATQGGTVVDGNCNVLSNQAGNGGDGGDGVGAVIGAGQGGNGGNGGNATANPDCSTTNVTNVTKTVAEKQEVVAQVSSAPKGGVHAGFGSTATKSSSTVALVGLTGSLSVVGLGLRFLKGEL